MLFQFVFLLFFFKSVLAEEENIKTSINTLFVYPLNFITNNPKEVKSVALQAFLKPKGELKESTYVLLGETRHVFTNCSTSLCEDAATKQDLIQINNFDSFDANQIVLLRLAFKFGDLYDRFTRYYKLEQEIPVSDIKNSKSIDIKFPPKATCSAQGCSDCGDTTVMIKGFLSTEIEKIEIEKVDRKSIDY